MWRALQRASPAPARDLQSPDHDGDIGAAPVTSLATAPIRRHGVLGGAAGRYRAICSSSAPGRVALAKMNSTAAISPGTNPPQTKASGIPVADCRCGAIAPL